MSVSRISHQAPNAVNTASQNDLITFLRHELAVPIDAIKLGLRQSGNAENLLVVMLWQYELATTRQLEKILGWKGFLH